MKQSHINGNNQLDSNVYMTNKNTEYLKQNYINNESEQKVNDKQLQPQNINNEQSH